MTDDQHPSEPLPEEIDPVGPTQPVTDSDEWPPEVWEEDNELEPEDTVPMPPS